MASDLIASLRGKKDIKILFVCLGNICRSPAAEGVMKETLSNHGVNWTVDSAGTGDYHIGDLPDWRMRSAAKCRGLLLTHHCRQVKPADFEHFDLIIGMDANNLANLRRMAPTPEGAKKVVGIGQWLDPSLGYDYVPDPYYESDRAFDLVLDLLANACENIYESLR
ncbi:MAG: low molecular weight phosphotyrosine protein phosphatase [Muribaculaceae bacterium]|nr:low molecular weight phosphotyrosine protein phosphatase [Muribaculaceae bacterium]